MASPGGTYQTSLLLHRVYVASSPFLLLDLIAALLASGASALWAPLRGRPRLVATEWGCASDTQALFIKRDNANCSERQTGHTSSHHFPSISVLHGSNTRPHLPSLAPPPHRQRHYAPHDARIRPTCSQPEPYKGRGVGAAYPCCILEAPVGLLATPNCTEFSFQNLSVTLTTRTSRILDANPSFIDLFLLFTPLGIFSAPDF